MYLSAEEARAMSSDLLIDQTDEQIERLIALYSSMVDEYCNTKFEPTTAEFIADMASQIRLSKGPLLQVNSITYQGDKLKPGIDYYGYPEKGLVTIADTAKYDAKKRSLHILYQYGYETVPAIVKKVVLDLIGLDTQSGDDSWAVAQENWDGEYSYQRNTNKTAEDIRRSVLAFLDIFKQPQYKPVIQGYGDVRVRLL